MKQLLSKVHLVAHEGEALLDNDDDDDNAHQNSGNKTRRIAEKTPSIGVVQILRHPLHRPAVLAVIGVMLAQQLCGMFNFSSTCLLLPFHKKF